MGFKKVLTAFTDKKFDALMHDWLEDIVGDDVPIKSADTCEGVLTRFDKSLPDLLVIDLALPADGRSPKEKTSISGLELIESEEARERIERNGPTVIVVDQFDARTGIELRINRLGYATRFPYARLRGYEVFDALDELVSDLAKTREGGAGDPESPAEKPVLTVEVSLVEEERSKVELKLTNVPTMEFFGAISPQEYIDIHMMSGMLQPTRGRSDPSVEDWKVHASHIGKRIYDSIFGGDLHQAIEDWRAQSNLTDEDMRIRFKAPSKKHHLLFETLTSKPDAGFKIIDTPIARQLEIDAAERRSGPRLREAPTLNILVINASNVDNRPLSKNGDPDFSEWVGRHAKNPSDVPRFRTLRNGLGEIAMFRDLDQAIQAGEKWKVLPNAAAVELRADIRQVCILDPDELGCETPEDFANTITKTLAARGKDGRDWHIVHYVGHSVAASADSDKSGYVILPGEEETAAISFDRVLAEVPAAGTRFVYFSSCQFGSAQVALATARRRVPSTLGFRWNVNDESALFFSRFFYQALFCDRLTVDEAVRDARRRTKLETKGDDPTWVSAVFTCYGEKWHRGYGERLCIRKSAVSE